MTGIILACIGLLGLVALITLQLLLLKKNTGLNRDQRKQGINPLHRVSI